MVDSKYPTLIPCITGVAILSWYFYPAICATLRSPYTTYHNCKDKDNFNYLGIVDLYSEMKDKMLEEYVVGLFDKLGCDTEVEISVGNHLEASKRVIEKFERRIDC